MQASAPLDGMQPGHRLIIQISSFSIILSARVKLWMLVNCCLAPGSWRLCCQMWSALFSTVVDVGSSTAQWRSELCADRNSYVCSSK